ncbi:MAG: glucosamine-6-phosphate deaminase [Actinomycetota bacterium]|jgi:glucosamine-6-phosphate deaminase|nr:glucosamine-6-phosphate deaminase [Actinomycetota bacterium]MDQ1504681.1 glucosamine-6-phosphate deaminase [Actinomycetota bacterium]
MDDVRLLRCPDRAALARETGRFVGDALAAHAGRFVALAVGDSTLPLYGALDVTDPAWSDRSITPVDELVPPPADPAQRFSARLAAALPVELRSRLVAIDVDGDAARRAVELDARLEADGLAVVVLGLGPDGHIAFNQPPTSSDAPSRVVDLAAANLSRLGPVSPARRALTLGVATILAAGSVLVVAGGAGKAQALDHLLTGPEDPAWPVTWLRRHARLTVATIV